jgi:hypothetical protein
MVGVTSQAPLLAAVRTGALGGEGAQATASAHGSLMPSGRDTLQVPAL